MSNKKLSPAAKAVRTRQQNARKRSAAANKAWKTRRANSAK